MVSHCEGPRRGFYSAMNDGWYGTLKYKLYKDTYNYVREYKFLTRY